MTSHLNFHRGLCAWSWDVCEDRVYWSDSLYSLFGLDSSLPPPNWESHRRIYSFESFSRLEAAVNECLETGLDYMLDLEAIDSAGRILNLEAHGAARRNEQGQIIGLTGVFIDRSAQLSAEEKFHAIADYTVDWESWFGLDGKYLWVNTAVERMTGYTPEEVLAMPDYISVLIDPEDHTLVSTKFKEALDGVDGGKGSDLKIQCLRKDGSKFWLEVSWQPIFDRKGNPLGLRASGRDITKRIRAEEMALKKTFQLKAILDSPAGIVFFSLDREYHYTAFSASHWKSVRKIWGVEIHIGSNMLDIISDPEDRKKAKANFDRVLTGEHFVLEESYGDESRCRACHENHCGPIRNDEGRITGLACFVIDITERRSAQRAVLEEKSRLDQFINATDDQIYFKDLDSRFVTVNAATLGYYGFTESSQIIGLTDADLYSREAAVRYREQERLIMETGEPLLNVVEYDPTAKTEFQWGSSSKIPINGDDGKVIGLMGIGRNITAQKVKEFELEKLNMELKEAMVQALAADRSKSEFLAVMSHELRTPLNGILGFAELLLEENQISSDVRDKVSCIQGSGQSLLRILEDILAFSRVEGGVLKLQSVPFSLSELAWKSIRIIEPDALAKALQLFVLLDEKLPVMLSGDPDRIQQILLNLLRNAVKYTDHGSVTLRAELGASGRVCMSVEDTGIGVPPDQQEKIFLPFTQGDSSLSRKFDGIGMGLTISQRLLVKMGSDLTLRSEEGKGSIFSFELSLPNASSSISPVANADSEPGGLDKEFAKRFPIKILAVEDNPMNLKLLVSLLGKLGYKDVLTANDGEQALAVLLEEQVHLIFMDLQMPVMDGLEATREIRSREARNSCVSPVRIIALTANASAGVRNECFTAGMNHYISKPFNIRSLAEALVVRN